MSPGKSQSGLLFPLKMFLSLFLNSLISLSPVWVSTELVVISEACAQRRAESSRHKKKREIMEAERVVAKDERYAH